MRFPAGGLWFPAASINTNPARSAILFRSSCRLSFIKYRVDAAVRDAFSQLASPEGKTRLQTATPRFQIAESKAVQVQRFDR